MALSDVSGMEDLKRNCEPPSLRLHKLKGSMKEYWSVTIETPKTINRTSFRHSHFLACQMFK